MTIHNIQHPDHSDEVSSFWIVLRILKNVVNDEKAATNSSELVAAFWKRLAVVQCSFGGSWIQNPIGPLFVNQKTFGPICF
jgi:hypothetical protein